MYHNNLIFPNSGKSDSHILSIHSYSRILINYKYKDNCKILMCYKILILHTFFSLKANYKKGKCQKRMITAHFLNMVCQKISQYEITLTTNL